MKLPFKITQIIEKNIKKRSQWLSTFMHLEMKFTITKATKRSKKI